MYACRRWFVTLHSPSLHNWIVSVKPANLKRKAGQKRDASESSEESSSSSKKKKAKTGKVKKVISPDEQMDKLLGFVMISKT